ncbi:uncharacterized protein BP5553_10503 [Venustampulla echinocandica]|uniref:Myb-like domain-containing protein n=1 Tax=Venustampulla echinocandica TaxID=2656787 RepID=A0A370T9H2_9HELO|nr:uncharacterized protein BP5553_10503 [Venustampulla echinocandica]RDL30225.1 hypothetical protein BP5553_10503 [Venustampulla echinocandica]
MDDIIFYQPRSTSSNRPPRFPGTLTASIISRGSITPISVRQTASQLSPRNEMWKDHILKNRDFSNPSQRPPSAQRCRNDTVQEIVQGQTTRYSPNNDDDDDLPDIAEILSGIKPNDVSASANSNSDDDDGFLDIDELLAGLGQKSVPTSAKPNSGGTAGKVDSGTRGSSPVDCNRSTEGNTQDPIILSDDESVGADSETDYSNLDVNLTKSDSYSLHVAGSDPAGSNGFGLATTLISDRLVAYHQDDANDNVIADKARLQLATDRPRSASPGYGPVTHQARPLRVNTEIAQRTASYVDLGVTEEVEDEGIDVIAKGDDDGDADTRSTKRSRSSAISCNNSASDSNVSVSELQDGQHDSAQFPQPDLTIGPPLRHRRRRDTTRNSYRKRPRTPAPTGLASAVSTVSAALESNDRKDPQSVALLAAPGPEQETRDIDQEIVDGGTYDSNDEDYNDISDAAASEIQGRPRSRKRVRRAKDTKPNDVETPSTKSLDILYQAAAATSPRGIHESEEIPIHGYLTLKTIESKVVYCLTFSQELLPEPSRISQKQVIAKSVSSSSNRRDSERPPIQERAMSKLVRNSRFSSEDDDLLLQLKGEGLSWDEISDRFPERSKGTLQVHYSTKLKPRSETSKKTNKRRRSG